MIKNIILSVFIFLFSSCSRGEKTTEYPAFFYVANQTKHHVKLRVLRNPIKEYHINSKDTLKTKGVCARGFEGYCLGEWDHGDEIRLIFDDEKVLIYPKDSYRTSIKKAINGQFFRTKGWVSVENSDIYIYTITEEDYQKAKPIK